MPSDLSEQQLLALLSSACCLSPCSEGGRAWPGHFSIFPGKYHLLLFLVSGTLGDPGDHLPCFQAAKVLTAGLPGKFKMHLCVEISVVSLLFTPLCLIVLTARSMFGEKIYLQPRKGPWWAFLWTHFADGGVVGEGSALPRAAPSSAQVLWLPSPWHHPSSTPPPVSERPLFQTLSVPLAWPSWGPWLSDSLVWVPPVYVSSAVCLPPCGATGRVRLCCSNKYYFTGFLTADLSFQCLSRMEFTSLSPGFLLQLCLFSSPWLPVLSGPVPCRPYSEVLGWPIPVLTETGQVHLLCPRISQQHLLTLGLCSLILWGKLSEQKFSVSVQIWSVEG